MPGVFRVRPEPVAIVAAGVVTPIGGDLDAFWTGLLTGASGISTIERFPVGDLRVQRGGEIKKLPSGGESARRCRASRLLCAAADDLRARAPLAADRARIGVVVGTALGGVEALEDAVGGERSLRAAAAGLYDSPAHTLAGHLGALGLAADLLRADRADLIVAGGYDGLCRFVMRGFDALRSLTRERIRPFDRRRSGLLLGEGAALVLMARDADVAGPRLGRLLGHASTSDATHVAAPDPSGRGLQHAIEFALAQAGLDADAVEFVSAHGTGTPLNDRIETAVLKRVLGRRAAGVPVNSIKAGMGHTMGAAATLEAIMCLLAARHGAIPHTLGFESGDAECDLDYVPLRPRSARPRVSLSTSLGFGGCNAALVLEGVVA